MKKTFLFVASAILFQSCSSTVPTVPITFIPSEKNQTALNLSVGRPFFSAAVTHSLSPNFSLVGGGNIGIYNHWHLNGGVQFSGIHNNFEWAIAPMIGYGQVDSLTRMERNLFLLEQNYSTNFTELRTSIFGNVQFHLGSRPDVWFGLGLRTVRSDLTILKSTNTTLANIHNYQLFNLEPMLFLKIGYRNGYGQVLFGQDVYPQKDLPEFWKQTRLPTFGAFSVSFFMGKSAKKPR